MNTVPTTRNRLRDVIAAEIAAQGPLPFARYMELCLYHPQLGFYSRAQEQFGKAGDFYTSSDVHAVFGRLLARKFEEMWRALGRPERIELIELGPGRGLFARDVLDWSAPTFPAFASALHTTLVEQSATLRNRLTERLADFISEGKATVVTKLDEVPPAANAIVFANEFFDALPVDVITPEGEVRVALEHGRMTEEYWPTSPANQEFIDRYGVLPEPGERVEAAPNYRQYMDAIAKSMQRGFCVFIDYGYTRGELLAGRHRGTVMAFRQHTASASPYEAPGEQDITAHVNFTALAGMGRDAGFDVQPLVTQAQFLMSIGEANEFADAFAGCVLPQERAKVTLQLKHLLTGMGETFQVLVGRKLG